jgi:hypothetical protein
MGDLARHQELKSINRAGIVGVIDKAFIHDFCASFCSYVAAQINVEFP